jgi:hypothetical protein
MLDTRGQQTRSQSGLPFPKKALLKLSHARLFAHHLQLLSHDSGELSSGGRDLRPHNAPNSYHPALYRRKGSV